MGGRDKALRGPAQGGCGRHNLGDVGHLGERQAEGKWPPRALTQVLLQTQAAWPGVCTGSARVERGAPSPAPTSLSRRPASPEAVRRAATAPRAPSSTAQPASRSGPGSLEPRVPLPPIPSPPPYSLPSSAAVSSSPLQTLWPPGSSLLPHVTLSCLRPLPPVSVHGGASQGVGTSPGPLLFTSTSPAWSRL